MKMIALVVFVLSILSRINAGAVQENSLTENCSKIESPLLCRISAGIARLVINPVRTLRLIKEVIAKSIDNFSLKEVLEAMMGAVSVPLSTLIHLPEVIKYAMEGIDRHVFPILKIYLKEVEDVLRERPLYIFKKVVIELVNFPPCKFFDITFGIVLALVKTGFPSDWEDDYENLMIIVGFFLMVIDFKIKHFECTDIFYQNTCHKIYHAFENIAVSPAFKFLNLLTALLEKIFKKVKEVVLPIVEKLSPTHLRGYCKIILSEETCANLFFYIKEMDEFGEK